MATVNLTDFDPTTDTFYVAFMTGRCKASIKRSVYARPAMSSSHP